MDPGQIAPRVPDYQYFMTVDEMATSTSQLADEFPDTVSVRTVGRSQRGSNIDLVSIGEGPKSALIVGAPHPNEPIGCMTIEFLTRLLCEDRTLREELGYTWHFIKAIDPDGVRLNEGWLKGPYTTTNYTRHFFRPAFPDQAEYTFPVDSGPLHFDRPTPETTAWMATIDEIRPRFQYTLHNAELGGVYYLVSDPCPALYDYFDELPGRFGMVLDPVGDPGIEMERLAPGVFAMFSLQCVAAELAASGMTDVAAFWPAGISSFEYSHDRYGTFSLAVEMPYWDSPAVNDQTPSHRTLRDVVMAYVEGNVAALSWLRSRLEAVTPLLRIVDSRLHTAANEHVHRPGLGDDMLLRGVAGEAGDRPATHAEAFLYTKTYRLFRQRPLTMFVRMLDEEIAAGNDALPIAQVREESLARLEEEAAFLETIEYRAIPIRDLVAIQACAGLAAAQHAARHGVRR